MEADVTAVCGRRSRHDPDRAATRHGTGAGSVTLGGRRVPISRPRVRAVDGAGELPVPAYDLFSGTGLLAKMAMGRMLGGLSTRRYPVGLEPVGDAVGEAARSTGKSAVSRRFVAMTETALADLLGTDLTGLDLVAVLIDGVHVADHLPEKLYGPVTERMRAAYHADSALQAQALLVALVRELDKTHPGAPGSLREGMAETLTVLRLDLPPTLARTLRSTNAIESMTGICRVHTTNVQRWPAGQMALAWCAAGMVQASSQFRRVNGHLHLPALRTALERERHVAATTVGADCNTQDVSTA